MIPYITTTTYPKTILKLTLTIFNMISSNKTSRNEKF
jgi:hypothetical protein